MNARRDIVVFAAFFVVVMTLRAGAAMAASSTGLDGGYYVTVANALLRGEGLRSNLSMYNFGYSTFPGPSGVYPLWPMLLAAAGTVFDIDAAGHWLPWALYGVTGIGIFGFGQAVTPSPRPALHAGHLFAAGFMLSPWFFTWTIAPLTEGLAWAITSLGFWRFALRRSDLSFRWGVELGLWCALAFFTRAQLMVLPIAVIGALALRLVLGPDRRALLPLAAGVLVPLAIGAAVWWAWLASFAVHMSPTLFLRFDRCRVTDLLPELAVMYPTHGLLDYLWDRLNGVGLAWSSSTKGYRTSFYALHWLLPLAIAVALPAWVRTPRAALAGALARLRAPDGVFVATLLLFSFGGILSVQIAHKQFGSPWFFDQRDGFIALPAFLFAGWWCFGKHRVVQAFALLLVIGSYGLGAQAVWKAATFKSPRNTVDEYGRLATWLQTKDAESPGPLIVALEEGAVQRTAWRTPEIGYHWLSTRLSYKNVGVLVHELGTDMVIWDKPRESWGFRRNGGHIEADYARVDDVPMPFTAVAPRATPLPAAPHRRVLLVGLTVPADSKRPAKLGHAAQFSLDASDEAGKPRWWTGLGGGGGVAVWEFAKQKGRSVTSAGWPGLTESGVGIATPDLELRMLDAGASLAELALDNPPDRVIVGVVVRDGKAEDTLCFLGADIPAGHRPRHAKVDDLAPTLAWLLGLPVPEDAEGRVLSEALTWDAAGALGRTDTPSWK